ncbi:condensin subunit, putative [Theileria annulata]|uniref:Condensin subunit, putative n=1 Tax=Theileria annulata TaxID=5874 RepID=Q4U9U1_THEAN|nr:condensin subunit, putative [Theileria annulata]CAI76412.1 condensin subunit, putative [Theileria annulata]|eukprot:XP_953037.1 condensin subunit, putative [Theileria annulata]
MDSANLDLRVFEIPETLDWRSLLRPPGPDYIKVLDASEAEDPEGWTENEISSAFQTLGEINFKNVGECLKILTPEVFISVFNLNRIYSNLEKDNQILLCQFLSNLCLKIQVILEAIPPKPYTSDKEASENITYTQFVNQLAHYNSQNNLESINTTDKPSGPEVDSKFSGLVLRSLISVSVFLLCMCYKFATTFERNEEKSTFDIVKEKGKRGRKSKKEEKSSKVNTLAIETLINSLMTCCKYNMKYPYASCYGGTNRTSVPMLRLLFVNLLHTLSLDESIHSTSKNMVQSIAKIIRVNFSAMQSNKSGHSSYNTNVNQDDIQETGKTIETYENVETPMRENEDLVDKEEGLEKEGNVDTSRTIDTVLESFDDEWLGLVLDEIKKPHCQVIVDVLELLKDSNIPNIIVNELFYNIKENYSSQISNTNQLVSTLVQNEFTNIGLFFEKMAKKVPCVVLSNIGQLKQLFDVPCYPLRKSIMEGIKLLIILSKYYDSGNESPNLNEDDEENRMELDSYDALNHSNDEDKYKMKISKLCWRNREMLLDIIISRQFDCYMYARACVLKVLYDIIEEDALPARKYNLVADFATERIMDRGSQVRQKALSLVSLIIEMLTNKKFMLKLNTSNLVQELNVIDNNISKVNFALSELSVRRYSLSSHSSNNSRRNSIENDSVSRERSRRGSLNFSDAKEYDFDLVILELKTSFGGDVVDKLEEIQTKLEMARELYSDAIEISERVEESLELCKSLLKSPTETDQRSAIRFISSSHLLGVQKATQMLPLAWALSWSNNPNVVESVLTEFKNVYFQTEDDTLTESCMLLIKLIGNTDLTCLSSVEKIFQINQTKQRILGLNLLDLIPTLISIATSTYSNTANSKTNPQDNLIYRNKNLLKCKICLNLIKIILASNQNSNIQDSSNKDLNVNSQNVSKEIYDSQTSFNSIGDQIVNFEMDTNFDLGVFEEILKKYDLDILLEVSQVLIYFENSTSVQDFIHRILRLFLGHFGNLSLSWFETAQSVIDLTFTHIKNPLSLWSSIINYLLSVLVNPDESDQLNGSDGLNGKNKGSGSSDSTKEVRKLSQLIFITGHVAIRSIIYIERLQNDLKAARSNTESEQLENNMGLATKDEMEREFFDNVLENKLVNDNLLGGAILKIIIEAIINPQQFIHTNSNFHSFNYFDKLSKVSFNPNKNHKTVNVEGDNHIVSVDNLDKAEIDSCLECNILFMCSVISLCKFATVSKSFCNIKLPNNKTIIQTIISLLLLEIDTTQTNGNEQVTSGTELAKNDLNSLKCNLLICYGDLLVRHPNIMEPMNDLVFKLLSHPVNMVRETAILVFSHLVMNDMIKPKGKLLDNVMFLTQDSDDKISNYARVFLNEIHRKNPNTIYNCFPEMLTTLSQPSVTYYNIIDSYGTEVYGTDDTIDHNNSLHGIQVNLKILNEVFNFVKNDKQEHLVEKICMRLSKAKSIFSTTLYINALLLINYDEKNIMKLSKSLNFMRQLLSESQPLLAALSIIHKRIKSSKVQKIQGQIDIKEIADEMINKVKSILGQGKATMLIRASKYAEQIIELLNNGNYTQTTLNTLFDSENQANRANQKKVKKEAGTEPSDEDTSSNSADFEDIFFDDEAPNIGKQGSSDSMDTVKSSSVNGDEKEVIVKTKKKRGRKPKARKIIDEDEDDEDLEDRISELDEDGISLNSHENIPRRRSTRTRAAKIKNMDMFEEFYEMDGIEDPEDEI